jgi:hypothetical protein
MCPIPGDNGQPKLERQKWEKSIRETALHGGDLKPELRFLKKEPPTKVNIK